MKKLLLTAIAVATLGIGAKAQYVYGNVDENGNFSGFYVPNDSGLSSMYENDRYWQAQEALRQQREAIEQQHRDLEAIQANQQMMIMQANQARNEVWWRSLVLGFKQQWLHQMPRSEKAVDICFIPGLGAAIKNNNWSAACSFYVAAQQQERAYEKIHHRVSPGYVLAARNAGYAIINPQTGKRY